MKDAKLVPYLKYLSSYEGYIKTVFKEGLVLRKAEQNIGSAPIIFLKAKPSLEISHKTRHHPKSELKSFR